MVLRYSNTFEESYIMPSLIQAARARLRKRAENCAKRLLICCGLRGILRQRNDEELNDLFSFAVGPAVSSPGDPVRGQTANSASTERVPTERWQIGDNNRTYLEGLSPATDPGAEENARLPRNFGVVRPAQPHTFPPTAPPCGCRAPTPPSQQPRPCNLPSASEEFALPFEVELVLGPIPGPEYPRHRQRIPETYVMMIDSKISYETLVDKITSSITSVQNRGRTIYRFRDERVELRKIESLSLKWSRWTKSSTAVPNEYSQSCSTIAIDSENCAAVLDLVKKRNGSDTVVVRVLPSHDVPLIPDCSERDAISAAKPVRE